MTERLELLESISLTIKDYRNTTIPDASHVDRWISQFCPDIQIPLLKEINHVLKKTYFSRETIVRFLNELIAIERLVGADPQAFLRTVCFLDIQGGGNSQRDMLTILGQILSINYGIDIKQCAKDSEIFVYLDDGVFTGNRVRRDIETWIQSAAPKFAKVHIVSIASHSSGTFYASQRIQQFARASGKKIDITWWRAIELEDRLFFNNNADVLRPTYIPDVPEVIQYVEAMTHKPQFRMPGSLGKNNLYSCEEGRTLLEQEFLKAGVYIRQICPNLGNTQRPLGHSTLETLGFGSLIVTFRNCPNNVPLALWAGDPWYPLFQRTTNSEAQAERIFASSI